MEATPGFAQLSSERRWAASIAAAALTIASLSHFGIGARGLTSAGFVCCLSVLAAIDLQYRVIPNRIVLPAAGIILVAQIAFFPGDALEWIASGLGAALALFLPRLFKADAVGMGDVKLALLLGVGLGVDAARALLLGSLVALPVALWILATRGLAARGETIPLGPFLAVGGVLALFLGDLPT
jgi:prepilin signal peptidase PulO-like enzyme (type II secretory pathway)